MRKRGREINPCSRQFHRATGTFHVTSPLRPSPLRVRRRAVLARRAASSACVGALARGAPEPRGAEVKCVIQPVVDRRSCLASSRLLYLVAAPCGARERRTRSDGRRARGARGARASRVVNHRRSRAGVSRRAAVPAVGALLLLGSSLVLSVAPHVPLPCSTRAPAYSDVACCWVCVDLALFGDIFGEVIGRLSPP